MKTLRIVFLTGALSFTGAVLAAAALPTGANVSAGSASFSQTGSTMTVTNINGTIIHWNSFSVGAGNTVQFIQPSAASKVMNRVLGSDPSQIYGQITSNGQVFLVNPNGIMVGPSGRIDASGIFLSTANIADADFLAGNIRFGTPPAGAPITISGHLDTADKIEIHAAVFDGSGGVFNAPNMIIDNGAAPPPPLALGGNITLGGASSGGTITLTGGTINLNSSGTPATIIGVPNISASSSLVLNSGTISTQDLRKLNPVGQLVIRRFPGTLAAIPAPSTGTLTVIQAPAAGTISLQGGTTFTSPVPAQTAQGTAPVAATPAPAATARSAAITTGPISTSGLVDGAVTVRLSLVDASPISLR